MANPRILIVEDEPDTREALGLALESDGYEIDTAIHGEDALAKLRAASTLPDLILLDQMMPVMNGAEFLRQLLADAQLKHLPVVAISAQTQAAANLPGAVAFVRKPLNLEDLLAVVRANLKTA